MSSETQERLRRDYWENRILSATPVEIVAMLYQVVLDNLEIAKECLKTGDRIGRSKAVTKSEQGIHELLVALDHSVYPEFSRSSAGLYRYALRQIIDGHAQESERLFQDAIDVLKPLASAWEEVRARSCEEPEEPAVEEPPVEEKKASDPYSAYREPAMTGSRDWSC